MTTSANPTGLVSLALCQIAGEDALAARVPVALEKAREVMERLVARLIAELGGRPVAGNVEGVLVAFSSVRSAVGFALRLQVDLLVQDWPADLLLRPEASERREGETVIFRGLPVRVAIHTGAETEADPVGSLVPAIDQAGRLAAAAHPGQVLLLDSTWRDLVGNPGVPFVLRDLGAHRLPGVLGRHRLLQVQPAALDRRPVLPPASLDVSHTNRPGPPQALLGRAGELAAIAELYRLGVRFVTLVGTPGAGGHELAGEVAAAARSEDLPGGVWWCAVSQRAAPPGPSDDSSAGDLVRSLADALGIGISHARNDGDGAAQLGWSLAARERLLVVFDGIDPNDGESAQVLVRWMSSAPKGRFLCLAPRRLGVPGEVVFQLGPLAVSPSPSDAARWLLQHVPTRSGAAPLDLLRVEPLAAAVGGLPRWLAIAGGLLGQLSPEELAARLGGKSEALAELAWEGASQADRDVLLSAACFVGPFEPWQIGAVVDPSLVDPLDVPAILGDLAGRSLLDRVRTVEIPSRDRYALPPLLRPLLASAPDLDRGGRERRWATSAATFAEAWAGAAHDRCAPEVQARLVGESSNLLAVVRAGLGTSSPENWRVDVAVRTLLALQPIFEARGPFVGQVRLLDLGIRGLDASLEVDPSVQVRMLAARAEAMAIRGKGKGCMPDLERGLEIARRWSDPMGEALCRLGVGVARAERLEDDPSADLEGVAAELALLDSPRRQAIALATAGRVHFAHGRTGPAESHLRAAVEIVRSVGARRDEGRFLADLARVLWSTGRLRPARSTFREASRLHAETGDRRREAHVAASLGDLDHVEGQLPEALLSYALAARIARETGERRVECHAQAGAGMVALEAGDIDGSRSSLLAALAIQRDVGDGRAEGTLVGQLGLVHHFGGLPTAAQDYYQRAIQLFSPATERRERATWLAWLGALLAENGELDTAREAHRQVTELLEGLEDRTLWEIVGLLACVVDLRLAATLADREEADRFDGPVRERYAAARAGRVPRAPDVRLALKRLELLMAEGFAVATEPP